jgi:hypothetical protein
MEFNIKKFVSTMKPFVDQAHTTPHNIVDHPFYQSPPTGDSWKFGQLNEKGQDILSDLVNKYVLPKEIAYLYLGLKDEKESFVYKRFTFMNLETTLRQAKLYQSENQYEFIDLAMTYGGMGYCWIVAWHADQQKYFMRLDGGSNGFECQLNYRKYVKTKIDWSNLEDMMMDWKELKDFLDQGYYGEEFSRFQKYDIGSRLK